MALIRHDHPLLNRIETSQTQRAWGDALAAIDEATAAGLHYSAYGTPLTFLRQDIIERRAHEARLAAMNIQTEADRVLQAGNVNRARHLYQKALQTPHLDAETHCQIQANIERLETHPADSRGLDAAAPTGHIDEQTVALLETIRQKRPNMHRFLEICATPLWMDAPTVAVLRAKDDGRDGELLQRLGRYSFVYPLDDGRYLLSNEVRDILLAGWVDDPAGYQAINARLAAYLSRRLDTDPPRNPAQYQRLVQARLYHTFLADPQAGVKLLISVFQEAEDEYQLTAARQYIVVLKGLEGWVPSEYYAYIEYAEGWFHHIRGNQCAACLIFEELAGRTELTPDLAARVQRGLGAVQAGAGEWVEAFDRYKTALAAFKALDEDDEVAETMVGLGAAHLDMAINAAGDLDPFADAEEAGTGLLAWAAILVRLPLIIYLILKLRILWPLPNLIKLGQGVDWVIARLYSDAILWFRRAEARLTQTENQRWIIQLQENMGRLYLALGDARRAIRLFEPLLHQAEPGSLARARAQFNLADALMQRGRVDEAKALWLESAPVFTALGQRQRMAQIQTRLGYAATRRNEPRQAVESYANALNAWRELGDDVRATDARHALEHIAVDNAQSADLQEAAESARARTPERVYPIRYIHPWMGAFQRIGIALFFALFFLALWSGVRTESGTSIGADIVLQRPVQAERAGAFRPTIADEAEVTTTVQENITPAVRGRFLGRTVGLALLVYLLTYTVAGLLLLMITKVTSVQRQQMHRLHLDDQGASRSIGRKPMARVNWADVRTLLLSNMRFGRAPVPLLSSFALASDDELVEFPGGARHYADLVETTPARVPQSIEINDTSISVSRSPMGWLFLGSLVALLLYVGLIIADKYVDAALFQTSVLNTSYRLADLYSLFFVGAGLPLYYWLILQPIRTYLARRHSLWLFWSLTGINVVLTFIAWLQFYALRLPLGRPDIVVPVVALFSIALTLKTYWQSAVFWRAPRRRVASVAISLILAASLLWVLGWEVMAFHHLTTGNARLFEVEKRFSRNDEKDRKLYEDAIDAYEKSLAIRNEPYIYNSQGNALTRLGRYEDAVTAYEKALGLDGDEKAIELSSDNLIYYQDLALAHREWASVTEKFSERVARYEEALAIYDQLLAVLEEQGAALSLQDDLKMDTLTTLYELRGATQFDLASTYYDDRPRRTQSWSHYEQALADYEKLIALNPDAPTGYVGRGWSRFFLRHREDERDAERPYLEAAIGDFETAIEKDRSYAPAYNGAGWARYYVSVLIPGNCIAGFSNDRVKPDYVDQVHAALTAFTHGLEADQGNGEFFRTRAQLHYILSFCGEPYDPVEELQLAVDDYHLALQAEPKAGWYYRLGTLSLALASRIEDQANEEEIQGLYEQAAQALLDAIGASPGNYTASRPYRNYLRDAYAKLGRSDDQALGAILKAMGKEDDDDTLIALAQDDLAFGKFGLAAVAMERVLERSPDNDQATKLLAKIMFRWAETYEGDNQPARYERAIEAATQALGSGAVDAETYLILGRAHLGLNHDAAAIAVLEQARALQADDPELLFDLGKAYLRLGDQDAARTSYQAAIAVADQLSSGARRNQLLIAAIGDVLTAPTDAPASSLALASMLVDAILTSDEAEFANAQTYFDAGEAVANNLEIAREQRNANAIPYFVRALSLDPLNPTYWTPLRTALIVGLDMGQDESAEVVLTIILGASNSQGVEPLIEVADSELRRDVFGLAAAALERAVSIEPGSEAAYTRLVETYYRWGARWDVRKRHEQAVDTADRVIAAGMENPDIHFYKGRALMALGRYDDSVDALALAANLAPYDADIFSRLGWAAYRARQYERSAEASGRATELRSEDPREYFNQGLAYVALGDEDAAGENYQAGIDVANAPGNESRRVARLNEAIGDLKNVQDDPAGLADQFIEMLEVALEQSGENS